LKEVCLKDLKPGQSHPGCIIWLQCLTGALKSAGVEMVVKDSTGATIMISLFNSIPLSITQENLHNFFWEGLTFGIKNPYMIRNKPVVTKSTNMLSLLKAAK
jgi:hypothetical protein